MRARWRLWILAVFVCCILILPRHSFAEPIQLFIDVASEAVSGVPLEVEILILNENGEVEARL